MTTRRIWPAERALFLTTLKIRFVHIVYDQNFTSEVLEIMANVKDAVDERVVYTPPRVVKMSDLNPGYGENASCGPGSGVPGNCSTGTHPGFSCLSGNSPNGACTTGSGVT
jgi:hypothetical protein